MGVIAKQGSLNTVYIVAGIGIGAISNIFIYPNFFRNDLDYLGFLQLFITTAALFAPFLTLGSVGIAVRYYPRLVEEKKEKLLNFYSWILPVFGLLIFALILVFTGKEFIGTFLKKNYVSDQLYLLGLFLLTFMMTFFRSLSGISMAKVKTDFLLFLNEVFVRLLLLFGLLLVYFKIINFEEFFQFHILTYFIQLIVLMVFFRKDYFAPIAFPQFKEFKETLSYGIYSLFDNIAWLVLNRADIFMIAYYLNYEKVAIYNLALFMSIVITIPNRALMVVTAPVIAQFVHDKNFNKVSEIYQKASLTQLLLGGIIFLLIWINFENVLKMGNLPSSYSEAKYVFLYLGISKLVDLIGSINGSILLSTPFYRYNLYFNVFLLVVAILLNILMIPTLGIEGAALATAISLALFNVMKGVFLYQKFKLNPFHKNTIKGILILVLAWAASNFIPVMDNFWLDILVRTSVACLIFIPTMLYFKISEDINDMFYKLVRRYFK